MRFMKDDPETINDLARKRETCNDNSTNIENPSDNGKVVKIAIYNEGIIEEHEIILTKQGFAKQVRELAVPACTAVYGSFGLGDALMITPALRGLKELLPNNPIHMYCRPRGYDVFLNNPDIDVLVAVPWSWRMVDVVHSYERNFTPNGKINGNPMAEQINAYELFAEMLACTPSSYRPHYFPKQEELEKALNVLSQIEVDPSRDRIAVIHPESSSLLRNIPLETIAKLVTELRTHGWVPLIVSQKLPPKKYGFEINNTFWTKRDFSELTLRDVFAMVQFASVVVGTDSVISHLAAAYDKPAVLLYGPFPADLRAKHFSRAFCLQANVECNPCFQHGNTCQIEGKIIPSCMKSFSVDSITAAIQAVTKQEYRQVPANHSPYEVIRKTETCRLCGCQELFPYVRKVNVFYERCARCDSAQTLVSSGNDSFFLSKRHQYLHRKPPKEQASLAGVLEELLPTVRSLLTSRREKPLTIEVGGCSGESVPLLSKHGFEIEIFEPYTDFSSELWAKGLRYWTNWQHMLAERGNTYDAAFLLHGIHFLADMHRIREVAGLLVNGGHLVLTFFATDHLLDPPRTQVLNSKPPGDIPLIPSSKGIQLLMKHYGLSLCWRTKIKGRTSELAVYRRVLSMENTVDCCTACRDGLAK